MRPAAANATADSYAPPSAHACRAARSQRPTRPLHLRRWVLLMRQLRLLLLLVMRHLLRDGGGGQQPRLPVRQRQARIRPSAAAASGAAQRRERETRHHTLWQRSQAERVKSAAADAVRQLPVAATASAVGQRPSSAEQPREVAMWPAHALHEHAK